MKSKDFTVHIGKICTMIYTWAFVHNFFIILIDNLSLCTVEFFSTVNKDKNKSQYVPTSSTFTPIFVWFPLL